MGALLKLEYTVLSRPAEVRFMGFRSDTHRLQQAGWEIAAEQDIYRDSIRLLLRHQDLRLYCMSPMLEFNFQQYARDTAALPVFDVVACNHKFDQMISPLVGAFGDFKQIDAQPQFIQREIRCIEDFGIFATPLVRTQELIVEPESVAQLLSKIRAMQVPEQERIRAKERMKHARSMMNIDVAPRQQFHAQIISLESYRSAA